MIDDQPTCDCAICEDDEPHHSVDPIAALAALDPFSLDAQLEMRARKIRNRAFVPLRSEPRPDDNATHRRDMIDAGRGRLLR